MSATSAERLGGIARTRQRGARDRLNARAERVVAGNGAQARQRLQLPGPGFLGVVALERRKPHRDRALGAGRAQLGVDLVERAFFGRRRKRADQPLREPGVEIARAGAAASAGAS